MSLEDEKNMLNSEIEPTRESVLAEIDLLEKNANQLPEEKDIEILKKIKAVWVLSGDDTTNHKRLDYANQWLSVYNDILPDNQSPILIYNGTEEQNKNLNVQAKNVYIAPGINKKTIDQVQNFSFPPDLNLEDGYLGVLSHSAHLPRILRFMGKNHEIFKDIKVIALPLAPENPEEQAKMAAPEIKGILDYIQKGEATLDSYPYTMLNKSK